MHSLVGLAAVFIAIAAVNNPAGDGPRRADHVRPQARAVHRHVHRRHHVLGIGDRVRQAVRAHPQRTGDVRRPAFRQSRARHRDDRLRHLVLHDAGTATLDAVHRHDGAGVPARLSAHHSDRRRGHAGGHLDAQQLLGLGGRWHRLLAGQPDADHRRVAGRLVRRDPVVHHVQGDEPLVLQRDSRRLWRRGRRRRGRRSAEAGQERQRRRCGIPAGECRYGDHRSRLRPGGRARAARGQGTRRQADAKKA